MTSHQIQDLITQIQIGGVAYVRNLAAAEDAVQKGLFNIAKILRAAAHTQRIIAMGAARLMAGKTDKTNLLEVISKELKNGDSSNIFEALSEEQSEYQKKLQQFKAVREKLTEILDRSLMSLKSNNDVQESDVHQFIWGCYSCGYLVEGNPPDACEICGALGVEFEWFGPFYAATPEHLGQLSPQEMIEILESIPKKVSDVISGVDDKVLAKKPSAEAWCIKEIIGHIIETDKLFVKRIETVLKAQGVPEIPRTTPPWKLHEGKGYETLSAAELINRLDEARAISLKLVKNLKNEDWVRQGTLMGTANSILDLGSWLTNHDRGHLAQIKNLC
jgi:rubrerythrin